MSREAYENKEMQRTMAQALVLIATLAIAATFAAPSAVAQAAPAPPNQDQQKPQPEHQHDMQHMAGMTHATGMHADMDAAGMLLMNESSGTGIQPSAWGMPMLMMRAKHWQLMWMGEAFLVETQQSGPRGGDKL